MSFLVWIVIAVALAIAEIFTAGFFILFFAIGAAVTALLSVFVENLTLQLWGFLSFSLLFLFLLRPLFKKNFRLETHPPQASNMDALPGQRVLVLEPVNRYGGKVKLLHTGEIWSAYLNEGDETLAPETEAMVVRVDGAKLVIERKES